MNNILLIVFCVSITCLEWQVVDGTVTCYSCKGHNCNWKSSWKKCKGDACFKRDSIKHLKITSKESVKINPSLSKDKNFQLQTIPPLHKFPNKTTFKTTTKSTTKLPLKTTTTYFFNFGKAATKGLAAMKPTNPFFKSTTLAINPPTVKATTKSMKLATTKTPYNSPLHHKGTSKPRHRRSHEQERGCMKENEVTHIKCQHNLCVCLKDLCNDQIKVSVDGALLIQSCFMAISILMGSRWNHV